MLRVQIPSPALAERPARAIELSRGRVRSIRGLLALHAAVAQLVEHFLGKEEVMGSIPISSSGVGS